LPKIPYPLVITVIKALRGLFCYAKKKGGVVAKARPMCYDANLTPLSKTAMTTYLVFGGDKHFHYLHGQVQIDGRTFQIFSDIEKAEEYKQ
jgi:hypothetical protein